MSRAGRVAVIGGGFSGAMTAAHLASRGVPTVVIEPGELGRGAAYARTPHPLLLNAPVSAMSALPEEPRHFEAWLERQRWSPSAAMAAARSGDRPHQPANMTGDRSVPGPRSAHRGAEAPSGPPGAGVLPHPFVAAPAGELGGCFAPRAMYGDYLEHTIAALSAGRLDVVRARAQAIERTAGGFAVRCDDGTELASASVVLALGNPAARTPDAVTGEEDGYVADPYRALADIGDTDPVALLGTGLTALDVIAALRAQGHRGRIVCASRRGLIPTAHAPRACEPVVVPRELVRQPHLPALLAWWRSRIERADAEHRGEVSQAMIAALRPLLSTLWRRLPLADRARFLRHVRPRWDVVRHRAPPSVRAVLDAGVADGSIAVLAARLAAVEETPRGLRCRFAAAGGGTTVHDVRWLVNCTGPERDIRRLDSPLVRSLVEHRMVEPDPLGLGVQTGPSGQLLGADGYIPDAFVVGPWRMADLWEASAVPELRAHAADTADALVGALAPGAIRTASV